MAKPILKKPLELFHEWNALANAENQITRGSVLFAKYNASKAAGDRTWTMSAEQSIDGHLHFIQMRHYLIRFPAWKRKKQICQYTECEGSRCQLWDTQKCECKYTAPLPGF